MKYSNLDIYKINHIRFTSFKVFVKQRFLFIEILKYLAKAITILVSYNSYHCIRSKNSILFVSFTDNNIKALEPIWRNLNPNSYNIINNKNHLQQGTVYLYSILYLPLFLKRYHQKTRNDKAIIRFYFADFIRTYGYMHVIGKIIKKSSPQLIVMANDHSLINRCFLYSAKEHGIETMYCQHASVTELFPPLDFTYSFLDGLESLEKYEKSGKCYGNIYLSGSPRMDVLSQIVHKDTEFIGLCLNSIDDLNLVKSLCLSLIKILGITIIIRPHPRMAKNFDFKWFISNNIKTSSPLEENSFVFLSKISMLIAGESSIHLDATLLGIRSISYSFTKNKNIKDWYSYQKNGLIRNAKNIEELISLIKNKTNIKTNNNKITYYMSSYNTPYWGHVGEMLADFINLRMSDKNISLFDKKYNFQTQYTNVKFYNL